MKKSLSPETLSAMADEFARVSMDRPRRKIRLGIDLHEQRSEVNKRLLEGARIIIADLDTPGAIYWRRLHHAYSSVCQSLDDADTDTLYESMKRWVLGDYEEVNEGE